MLRLTSQRLLAASRPIAARPLSTTSPLLIKIRRPEGAAPPPSPAERPPPPANIPSSKGSNSNPVVNQAGSTGKSRAVPSSGSTQQQAATPSSSPSAATPSSAPPSGIPTKPVAPKNPAPPVAPTTPDQATTPAAGAEIEPEIDLSKLPSLDVDSEAARLAEPEPAPEGEKGGEGAEGAAGKSRQRTGAGRKEYVSSIERQRRAMLRWSIGGILLGTLGVLYYGGDEKQAAQAAQSGQPTLGFYDRIKHNANEFFDYFNKPAFKTLLPDPLPPPHQRPYTLLVDLEGMLTTSTWDRQHGWRTAKRPGADYFLAYLSLFYEVVLFTSQPSYTAMGVAEKLDPFQAYIPYKLFRESTRTVDGKVVKDLSYLNRDLSKVILLDTNPEHAALQPENAIIIKPWEGKGGEQGLVELIPFLESLAFLNVQDVRPTLKAYQGKDIPQEYAKIEAEQKRLAIEQWEKAHPSRAHGAGTGMLSSIFGGVSAPGRSKTNQPMTYIEQKRALAQAQYQEEQKYWRDHAEEFTKLIEEDKQRQLAEMKGSLWTVFGGKPDAPTEKK